MSISKLDQSLHKHFSSLLQGNIAPIIQLMQSVDPQTLSDGDQLKRDGYLGRFVAKEFPKDDELPPFVQALLHLYHQYWHALLMQEQDLPTAADHLGYGLNKLLLKHGYIDAESRSMNDIEEIIIKRVEAVGLGILMGVTRPYRECMIWKSCTKKAYTVDLHDTESNFEVVFLEDFASLGWIGFASLNKVHTGGWANRDAIYRVGAPPEDEADEQFYLDILCHEGRHFSDYGRFPNLQQPELEYRGKMTELCFANSTVQRRIGQFINSSSSDPGSAPHTLAAYYVMRDLARALFATDNPPARDVWQSINVEVINASALNILDQNNQWLDERDPKGIESFLGVFEFRPNPNEM